MDGPRVYVEGETAKTLAAKLEGLTGAQGEMLLAKHEGEWLEASGIVIDVTKNEIKGMGPSLSLHIGGYSGIYCMFDEGDESPFELNKHDGATVQGQIMRMSVRNVPLQHCRIVQVVPRDQLKALASDEPETANLETEPPAQSDKPRLPDAALELWFQAFKLAYPKGSQMLAEKSAVAAFPDHHVARSRIRELIPNSPRGRPKKNNGLDNSPESDGG